MSKKTTKRAATRAGDGALKVMTVILAVVLVIMIIITAVKVKTSFQPLTLSFFIIIAHLFYKDFV
jgi:hypothetical protein